MSLKPPRGRFFLLHDPASADGYELWGPLPLRVLWAPSPGTISQRTPSGVVESQNKFLAEFQIPPNLVSSASVLLGL